MLDYSAGDSNGIGGWTSLPADKVTGTVSKSTVAGESAPGGQLVKCNNAVAPLKES